MLVDYKNWPLESRMLYRLREKFPNSSILKNYYNLRQYGLSRRFFFLLWFSDYEKRWDNALRELLIENKKLRDKTKE